MKESEVTKPESVVNEYGAFKAASFEGPSLRLRKLDTRPSMWRSLAYGALGFLLAWAVGFASLEACSTRAFLLELYGQPSMRAALVRLRAEKAAPKPGPVPAAPAPTTGAPQ